MGTFEDFFALLYVISGFLQLQEIGQDVGQYHGVMALSPRESASVTSFSNPAGVQQMALCQQAFHQSFADWIKRLIEKREREGVEYTVDLEVMVSATTASFLHYQQFFSLTSATS